MNYCDKCGRELQPGEVCNCQQTNNAAAVPNAVPQAAAAKAPEGNKNMPIVIGAAVAAAVVVILAIILMMGASTYKTPIKKMVKLINSQSTDILAYNALISDPMQAKYMKSVVGIMTKNKDYKEEYKEAKEDIKDFYDDYKGFKITKVEFAKAKEMKGSELRDIEKRYNADRYEDLIDDIKAMDKGDYEDLADDMDMSIGDAKKFAKATQAYCKACTKVDVTKGYEVTVRMYGKYEGETDKTEKIESIRVIKMNGTWYIYDSYDFFQGITFSKDLEDVRMGQLYRKIGGFDMPNLF